MQAAEAHSNSPMPHSTTSIQAFAAPSALSACDRSPLTSFSGPSLWSSLSFHPLLCEKDWFFFPVTPHPFSKKVCCETSRPATRRRTTEAAYRHVITRGLAAGSSFALAHCRRTLVLQAPSLPLFSPARRELRFGSSSFLVFLVSSRFFLRENHR